MGSLVMTRKKKDDDEDRDGKDAQNEDTSDEEAFDEDAERPWDEARWEKEFKLNDARADRFGELLETFIDHPNRDEIVAREMGWNELADDLSAAKESGELDDDDDDDEPFDASEFLAECDAASAAAPSAL